MTNARYVAIFISKLKDNAPGYDETSDALFQAVEKMRGFLGFHSVRNEKRDGITVSYWDSLDSIKAWAGHPEHQAAKARGRKEWYESFEVQIAKLEDSSWRKNLS